MNTQTLSHGSCQPRRRKNARPDDLFAEFPEVAEAVRVLLATRISRNTQLAIRADLRQWRMWCAHQHPPIDPWPATPGALCEFIRSCSPPLKPGPRGLDADAHAHRGTTRKASTLTRYLASLATLHRLSTLPDPTRDPRVVATRAQHTRGRGAKRQKLALTHPIVCALTARLNPEVLSDLRSGALLWSGASTLARRSELVALDCEDLAITPDGYGVARIRCAKNDPDGLGSERYLSPLAVPALRGWLRAAGITAGAVFRPLHRSGHVLDSRLSAHAVGRIYKQLLERFSARELADLFQITLLEADPEQVVARITEGVASSSTRIGAVQDLLAGGATLMQVMQDGGWKKAEMPALYGRRLQALRSGMAQLWRARRGST